MQQNNELEAIMEATGEVPVSCQCTKCADMCRKTPCLGTPADILTLIENGYTDKLDTVFWAAGLLYGIPPIPMVQFNKNKDGSCVMFRDGHCTIHDTGLKPTEGVLVKHDSKPSPGKLHLTVAVASTWFAERNYPILEKIIKAIEAYDTAKTATDGNTPKT